MDVQDGVLVLIPQPEDYVECLAGLHREIWEGVDWKPSGRDYLNQERNAWTPSNNA